MEDSDILRVANQIAAPHGLRAEVPPGVKSVGVAGDSRTYKSVVVLTGRFPGHDVLASVSTEISNRTEGCRVTFEFAARSPFAVGRPPPS